MRINSYKFPSSSFLAMEKDMSILVDKMLQNDNLKKLLYYPTKDCLSRPNLTEDQSLELFGRNIKLVPKLYIDSDFQEYIIIRFDDFVENASNPEFRNNMIIFDIVCHYDQWQLNDFKLRPFRIAAELDTIFTNQRLTGIGEMKFVGACQTTYTSEYAGVCLMFLAVHGEEDRKDALDDTSDFNLIENFNKMFNE